MRSAVRDIMTTQVFSVGMGAEYREIIKVLLARNVSALPVTDDGGRVVGVVTEEDLLHKEEFKHTDASDHYRSPLRARMRARLSGTGLSAARTSDKALATRAGELMAAPAVTASPATSAIEAARSMERHGVEQLPVVDGDGLLVGIVSRRDVLRTFLRSDEEISRDVRTELASAMLPFSVEKATVNVEDGVVTLSGAVDRRSDAYGLLQHIGQVEGVVSVVSGLTWHVDDGGPPYTQVRGL
ncbi:CBS domain-containing protein [Allosalinactinospora lopnorensis]|uniref:CBS domain-containing protein n=1 Tax=Allosalinactinospora lopnorensis TaxID=1352348 RepID=UPI000623C72E|nr:CBS domain-containing protein [Allosalinactinospora lopnorensis]